MSRMGPPLVDQKALTVPAQFFFISGSFDPKQEGWSAPLEKQAPRHKGKGGWSVGQGHTRYDCKITARAVTNQRRDNTPTGGREALWGHLSLVASALPLVLGNWDGVFFLGGGVRSDLGP